jgi:hypothetical protein
MSDKRKDFEFLKKYYKPLLPEYCQNCLTVEDLVIHHIVPISVGGTNYFTNLCVLCGECHSKIHRNTEDNKISIKELSAIGSEHKKQIEASKEMIEAAEMYQSGLLTVKEINKLTGVSRSALYDYIKRNNITRS